MKTWQQYVRTLVGSDKQTEVAHKTGIAQATISRWLTGEKVPTNAAQAAKLATEYGDNPRVAFVAADMLTVEQAGRGLSARERMFLQSLAQMSDPAEMLGHVAAKGDIEGSGEEDDI